MHIVSIHVGALCPMAALAYLQQIEAVPRSLLGRKGGRREGNF